MLFSLNRKHCGGLFQIPQRMNCLQIALATASIKNVRLFFPATATPTVYERSFKQGQLQVEFWQKPFASQRKVSDVTQLTFGILYLLTGLDADIHRHDSVSLWSKVINVVEGRIKFILDRTEKLFALNLKITSFLATPMTDLTHNAIFRNIFTISMMLTR